MCPSDESEPRSRFYNGYAATNYVVVHAGNLGSVSDNPTSGNNGLFAENSGTTFGDVKDGLEYTVMIGERRLVDATHAAGIWMRSIDHDGSAGDGSAVAGICHRSAMLNDLTSPDAYSSTHAGGAHLLAADGSVRFLSQTIAPGIYERLAGINDGKTDDDF